MAGVLALGEVPGALAVSDGVAAAVSLPASSELVHAMTAPQGSSAPTVKVAACVREMKRDLDT
jgi:hypothetical protein